MNRRRFHKLWARCCRAETDGEASGVFNGLSDLYSQPDRHYHTPGHIEHCLRQFDLIAGLLDDPDAVEMALWFHDAIYDAAAYDNEQRSAQLFVDLVGAAVAEPFERKVWDLIMVTKHPSSPRTSDEAYMVDIDLSSFGLPWAKFTRDSHAVRKEFAHLSEESFATKQRSFLEALLDREHFCFTEFFRTRHEASARRNISQYLKKLGRARRS